MKKMLVGAATLLALAVSVSNAQDDYEDYAYEEGLAESAPEYDEDYSTAQGTYSNSSPTPVVVSDQGEIDKMVAAPSKSSNPKAIRFGLHLGIGFSGTYNNEKADGVYYNPGNRSYDYDSRDPFKDFIGLNMDLGFLVVYRINNFLAFAPEFNVRMIDYFKESDIWYIEAYDRWGYYDGAQPVDETMFLLDLSIPLMVRAYAGSSLYFEVGPQFNINLIGRFTLENSDYDYSEDMGDWSCEPFGMGLNFGVGYSINSDKISFDLGIRFMMDFTRLESDEVIVNDAGKSYRDPVDAKAWSFQVYFNWLI